MHYSILIRNKMYTSLQEALANLSPFKICPETERYLDIVSRPYDGQGEKHHVLPRSMFPEYSNAEWNIVNLKCLDHFLVHELLPFMVDGLHRYKALHAWNLMSNRFGRKIDSAEYEQLKLDYANHVSQFQSGENHPMFGKKMSPESRARMSEAQRAYFAVNTVSEETRRKMAESQKSRPPITQEIRDKLSRSNSGENNGMFGKSMSEENRKKMSDLHKGVPKSESMRAKLSAAISGENHHMWGKQHTEESKQKISESTSGEKNGFFGKEHSEDAKNKIASKNGHPVQVDDKIFVSLKSAARAYGVADITISRWIKNGKATLIDKPKETE